MRIAINVAAAAITLFVAGVGVLFVLNLIFTRKRNRERWDEVREISPVIAAAIFPGNQFTRTLKVVSELELIDWVHRHLWPIPSALAIQNVIDILVYDRVLRRRPYVEPVQRSRDCQQVRAYKYTFTEKGLWRFFPYWEYPASIEDNVTAGVPDNDPGHVLD